MRGMKKEREKQRKVWKTYAAKGRRGERRRTKERNVNRKASTRLSGQDKKKKERKHTEPRACMHTNTHGAAGGFFFLRGQKNRERK